ncbi:MAG TPA: flavin reductase family protein [Candidatus Baltobacteraceae bacterium]|jgi:flavin reductase|nr:flavin reductase family protein [Candidatus Baltobacteraceae bacterium]
MTGSLEFKHAMRHVPTGVTVVTSFKDGEPRGITVNAFASVSADPPTLLICINRAARSYLYIAASGVFCVNVLAGNQHELAERFSGKIRDRQFEGVPYGVGETGAPVLEGTIAHFECSVSQEHHAGSHSIFLGRVVACVARAATPLGYFNGGFRDFGIEVT